MSAFKSPMAKRLAISKWIWFIIWLIAFVVMPMFFNGTDLYIRFWVWLWYISFWAIIWVFWVMRKVPVLNIPFPYWFRWIVLWAWLNFVLAFFVREKFMMLMIWTAFEWLSPFWLVLEWIIFWLLIDFFATKYAWDWKKLAD